MTPAPPPFPEAALRAVLAGAVAAWAASPPAMLDEPSAGDEPRRLYLDAFAGAEFQFGTGVARGGDEETRAAAALGALEQAGSAPPPVAVFAEEDPAHLGRIYAELEESAGERLRATGDLASLAPGEVSLLEMPFATAAGDVARFAAGARTFALVAPPAARALPWSVLRAIAALPDATLLVRLPHSDFEKQSRHNSPLADLPGFVRRIVEGCSAMLDDPRHAWLPAWRAEAAARGQTAALAGVMERLRTLLDGVAAGRILKTMELEAKDGARTWLLLLTPDPAIALAANAAVRAAKVVDRAAAASPPGAAEKAPGKAPAKASAAKIPSAPANLTPEPSAPTPGSEPDLAASSPDVAADAKPSREKSRRAPASSASPASPVAAAADTDDPGAVDVDSAHADASDAETQADSGATSPAYPLPIPESIPPSPVAGPEPPAAPAPQPGKAAPPPPVAEVLDLFGEQLAPAEMPEFVLPDPAVLAASVEARFAGSTVAWREILRAFAATDATPTELKAALAVLRRGGRATFKALKTDDAVTFPTEPIVREKPKRARKVAKDDGGFFGGGEESEGGEGSEGGERPEGGDGSTEG